MIRKTWQRNQDNSILPTFQSPGRANYCDTTLKTKRGNSFMREQNKENLLRTPAEKLSGMST
jgi:hypothetical protein